jgi:hypothetical protein
MRGEGITWDYFLAEKLHMTVAEVQAMPNAEYETWQQYYPVKKVLADLAQRTETNRSRP